MYVCKQMCLSIVLNSCGNISVCVFTLCENRRDCHVRKCLNSFKKWNAELNIVLRSHSGDTGMITDSFCKNIVTKGKWVKYQWKYIPFLDKLNYFHSDDNTIEWRLLRILSFCGGMQTFSTLKKPIATINWAFP